MVAHLEFLKKKGFIVEYDNLMGKQVYVHGEIRPYTYCFEDSDGSLVCSKGTGSKTHHTNIMPDKLFLHYMNSERPINFELISDMPFMPKGKINRVIQQGDMWGVQMLELGLFMDIQIMLLNPTIFKPIYKVAKKDGD